MARTNRQRGGRSVPASSRRSRRGRARRLLLYSHDTVGMGNIQRTLRLARAFSDEFADAQILVISGSPVVQRLRLPARVDTVKLPCLDRTATDVFRARAFAADTRRVMRMRREMLTTFLADFDPDLVVVDKRPFGVAAELLPGIESLRRRGRARIVLGLRDVLDEPARARALLARQDGFEAIERFFDEVWIYGCAEVFDPTKEYAFPDPVIRRTRFCGYVCPPAADAAIPSRRSGVVFVTVGGGDDGEQIVETCLDGLSGDPRMRACRVEIVLGPQMPGPARARLRARAQRLRQVRLHDFVGDMRALYTGAGVVVSMAGYGTICELLAHGRRAVLVPRAEPVREQLIRARCFAARDRFGMVEPAELSPSLLAARVAREFQVKRRCDPIDVAGVAHVRERARMLLHAGPE